MIEPCWYGFEKNLLSKNLSIRHPTKNDLIEFALYFHYWVTFDDDYSYLFATLAQYCKKDQDKLSALTNLRH